jgi:hypothetical protein
MDSRLNRIDGVLDINYPKSDDAIDTTAEGGHLTAAALSSSYRITPIGQW